MKIRSLKSKLWVNIFIRVAAIFLAFTLILTLSNMTFLLNFFVLKEKNALVEQIERVERWDLNDKDQILKSLSKISEKRNFDVEIYNSRGSILYTTHGGQMMDFFHQNDNRFTMSHEEMRILKEEDLGDGITFKQVVRSFDKSEYLLCQKEIEDGIFAEVRIKKQLIADSAQIANEFIAIIAAVCLGISIIWIFVFARKFSKPISQMNKITKDMAALDFKRRLEINSKDEIGQLAASVNELSNSLSLALNDLNEKNKKLQDDIEAERRLDSMRKTFIANVSHELKTPISIINGYAEGLKLDINPKSREEYCNIIIEEGNRMNGLVLSILELSKYESEQIPLSPAPTDMGIMGDRLLSKLFHSSKIQVQNLIPENTVAFADGAQIEQALSALLENAAVHTPENGSVTLTAEGEDIIRISVFNTGSHIEREQMSQIWQSFYRGDTSHKRDSSRFGLGLSIVAAILKMHNSRCGVYNTDDGVCFWFELARYNEKMPSRE